MSYCEDFEPGWGMEDIAIKEMIREQYREHYQQNRPIWTCADGTKIAIEDMTDKHLINAIKYIERRKKQGKYRSLDGINEALKLLKTELINREWGWL